MTCVAIAEALGEHHPADVKRRVATLTEETAAIGGKVLENAPLASDSEREASLLETTWKPSRGRTTRVSPSRPRKAGVVGVREVAEGAAQG